MIVTCYSVLALVMCAIVWYTTNSNRSVPTFSRHSNKSLIDVLPAVNVKLEKHGLQTKARRKLKAHNRFFVFLKPWHTVHNIP